LTQLCLRDAATAGSRRYRTGTRALQTDDAYSREELLSKVDTAMYEAKSQGRNRIVFAEDLADN
jgi:GGDEF domain-containing protein